MSLIFCRWQKDEQLARFKWDFHLHIPGYFIAQYKLALLGFLFVFHNNKAVRTQQGNLLIPAVHFALKRSILTNFHGQIFRSYATVSRTALAMKQSTKARMKRIAKTESQVS